MQAAAIGKMALMASFGFLEEKRMTTDECERPGRTLSRAQRYVRAMQIVSHSSFKLPMIALTLGMLVACGIQMRGQEAPAIDLGNVRITGTPEDWTHHRLVFSNPGTEEDAIRKGTHERWLNLVHDPRYVLQQLRRGLRAQGPAADLVGVRINQAADETTRPFPIRPPVRRPVLEKPAINKDWNEVLGTTGTPGYGVYPVKWSLNFASASCANDFVTYPTGQTGSATQASIIAYYNLYSGCGGTVPEVDWAYNTGGTIALAPVASLDGTQLAFIQTAKPAAGTATVTFTANPTAASSSITVGGIQYLYETSCTGYTNCIVVGSNTTQDAENLEAAINDNSSQCGSTAPCFNVTGANTQASATHSSSTPAVTTITNNTGASIDFTVFNQGGNTLPYTLNPSGEIIPGGVASLVILRIPLTPPGTGTSTSPVAPTAEAATSYVGCTAPCMTSITLSGSPTDTASNPYYDYVDDTLYVGDSVGKIHRFSPVFNGTPAEVTTSWPVQLARGATNDTNQAASPVYDPGSGYLLVGSTGTALYGAYCNGCGYFYSIGTGNLGTTSGSIHGYSGQLDAVWGIRDAPLVDSTAGVAYVFAGNDGTVGKGYGNNNVNQFATNFTTGSGTKAALPCPATDCKSPYGTGGTSNGNTIYQMAGTFDNAYYSGSTGTGNLYVAGTGDGGYLYQIPIKNSVMGTPVAGPSLAYGSWYYGRFSPITEFYNTGTSTDYIFMSVFAGTQSGCNYGATQNVAPFYGCIMSFNVTTPSNFSSSMTAAGTLNVSSTEYNAPTGGIIIDNSATTPSGASQIYFETNEITGTAPCTGICAVQASQSAP
jgi:hypothetical protein